MCSFAPNFIRGRPYTRIENLKERNSISKKCKITHPKKKVKNFYTVLIVIPTGDFL